ncbi:hypothetical protein U1Q18_022811 [Sarracenia purpurea var. burkii]
MCVLWCESVCDIRAPTLRLKEGRSQYEDMIRDRASTRLVRSPSLVARERDVENETQPTYEGQRSPMKKNEDLVSTVHEPTQSDGTNKGEELQIDARAFSPLGDVRAVAVPLGISPSSKPPGRVSDKEVDQVEENTVEMDLVIKAAAIESALAEQFTEMRNNSLAKVDISSSEPLGNVSIAQGPRNAQLRLVDRDHGGRGGRAAPGSLMDRGKNPNAPQVFDPRPKPWNWAALLNPSTSPMQLEYIEPSDSEHPDIIEIEEDQVDKKSWETCLVGYFLDADQSFGLIRATARTLWGQDGLGVSADCANSAPDPAAVPGLGEDTENDAFIFVIPRIPSVHFTASVKCEGVSVVECGTAAILHCL